MNIQLKQPAYARLDDETVVQRPATLVKRAKPGSPRRARRAAFVISAMALAGVVLVLSVTLWSPRVAEVFTLAGFILLVTIMGGAAGAVFGTRLIKALRLD